MNGPSVVLVPGSFAQPELYDIISDPLAAQGYDIHGITLRSALPRDATPPGRPTPSMYDDAAAIADKVKSLADEAKDIIIIAHSYGGTPASESIRGLSKAARQRQGKPGGVVRLAFITCLVGDVGQSAGELLKSKTEDKIPAELNSDGWMHYVDLEPVARLSFSDLPYEEALEWAARLGWHSARTFGDPLEYAGYLDVPVSWLFCENDRAIPRTFQQAAIELIERKSGKAVEVFSIKAGHVPVASQRGHVMEWVTSLLNMHKAEQ